MAPSLSNTPEIVRLLASSTFSAAQGAARPLPSLTLISALELVICNASGYSVPGPKRFGPSMPSNWTSDRSLDVCQKGGREGTDGFNGWNNQPGMEETTGYMFMTSMIHNTLPVQTYNSSRRWLSVDGFDGFIVSINLPRGTACGVESESLTRD
ncbi:hypothetical protein EDB83DRAFT_2318007 [Lactarius deliciosus]|nr:hypothetical protein EDB83DRAFT_2318007 [Lactarius deliciosus]